MSAGSTRWKRSRWQLSWHLGIIVIKGAIVPEKLLRLVLIFSLLDWQPAGDDSYKHSSYSLPASEGHCLGWYHFFSVWPHRGTSVWTTYLLCDFTTARVRAGSVCWLLVQCPICFATTPHLRCTCTCGFTHFTAPQQHLKFHELRLCWIANKNRL